MFGLSNEVLDSFVEVNKKIYELLKKDAEQAGLTVVQLATLHNLSSRPNIHLGDLASQLRMTNSTMSGVIDRLVHSGLVERAIPPENRRSVSINLTEKGKDLIAQITSKGSIFVKKVNSVMDLPEEELQQLLRLHKLVLSKLALEEEETL
ncbi:MAG: MarR family transcriptional regulator [Bacillota bacterium]|nr:MarR family transcriptional regulator [Bacillota bacterium]